MHRIAQSSAVVVANDSLMSSFRISVKMWNAASDKFGLDVEQAATVGDTMDAIEARGLSKDLKRLTLRGVQLAQVCLVLGCGIRANDTICLETLELDFLLKAIYAAKTQPFKAVDQLRPWNETLHAQSNAIATHLPPLQCFDMSATDADDDEDEFYPEVGRTFSDQCWRPQCWRPLGCTLRQQCPHARLPRRWRPHGRAL